MSRRIQIVLPDPAVEQLRDRAATDGTPPSTLAARLVRERLEQLRDGDPTHPTPTPGQEQRRTVSRRPPWLEPYGPSRDWRAEAWGAILALHARYPRALGALRDGWWEDDPQLETLCALAAWRAELDTARQDPREELAFHAQLADYAQTLKAEGGGVERAWKPGAPPPDWATSASP
ncbi:MAG TPA: hypothetical protein VN772_05595 [Solirubrobacteraceae bacterium]|nr:hypothetical protein [Solirubrobacteraceae bacterium]